jgi:hypothetical protein
LKNQFKSVLPYFKSPFPAGKGFSPYRAPGPAVHLPVVGLFVLVGYLLFYPFSWMWLPMTIISLIGFYIGRDLAIAAHYNLLITLTVWASVTGLFIFLPPRFESIRIFLATLPVAIHLAVSLWLLACILLLFLVRLKIYARQNSNDTGNSCKKV